MATAEQIKSLIKAYSAHDEEKFKTVVLQIAAHEAKLGHGSIAQELKKEVDKLKSNSSIIRLNIEQNPMLQYSMPSVSLAELIVSDSVIAKVKRVLLEYRNKNKLYNSGLSNRRKILLEGNPGTGKTMTASVIASELGLPLFTVQMDKLVTKFMGETSIRLRQIFDSIANDTGVYFFDEFDAIGADRSLDNEVGEMRRILNSFLQFLEMDSSESIIIAATNNCQILDKALFRRFEDVIHYDLPDEDQVRRLIEFKLGSFADKSIYEPKVIDAASGLSHAELTIVCEDVLKEAILFDVPVTGGAMISTLDERRRIYQDKEA